jgi:hypothetical protein
VHVLPVAAAIRLPVSLSQQPRCLLQCIICIVASSAALLLCIVAMSDALC